MSDTAPQGKKAAAVKTETKPAAAPRAETGKECKVSRKQWKDKAPVAVTVPPTILPKKEYASGSFGYSGEVSIVVDVDGVPTKVKGHLNLTVPYSANAKDE
jgi:hypothetical protein